MRNACGTFVTGQIGLILVSLSFGSHVAIGDVRVAEIFGDNMVLQRDVEVPVWGWAAANDEISVSARDQSVTSRADADGKWMARLRPMDLGEPFPITIAGPDNTITLKNVVVGEVWICSGQSNMEWPVVASANAAEEMAAASYPLIRHVKITRQTALEPQSDTRNSGWQVCSPQTVGNFTAVGYYFARDLHQQLNVPIGLINSSWGGTMVEAWTSAESLKGHPDFAARMKQIEREAADLPAARRRYAEQFKLWKQEFDQAMKATDEFAASTVDDTDWTQLQAPGHWEQQGFGSFDGVAWYRRTVDLPEPLRGKKLSLSLAKIDDEDRTFVNGQLIGTTSGHNVARRYTVPPEVNNQNAMTIAVQVRDFQGAGGFHGQSNQMAIHHGSSEPIPISGKWKFQTTDLARQLPPQPKPPGLEGPHHPSVLFNAMIHPLIPFAYRGVIWYQGESNANRAFQYRSLFPLLIRDWRQQWNRQVPFYWVQLANFRPAVDAPGSSAWAELREAQSLALKLPATGQAVIIDIGEAQDIHPRNKQDVGRRLARHALQKNYGVAVEYSGPQYREMQIEGHRIRLRFNYADGLQASDGQPLRSFAIAGQDRKFAWADAQVEGEEIVVSSPDVEQPVAVRYAWADNPDRCNLTNDSGLPASPFRTDDWPGVTGNVDP